MIRKLAFLLLLIVLGCVGYLVFSIYENLQEKQAIEKRIATLPEFSLSNLDGEQVQAGNEARQTPLIITYFNTGCEFCKAEIRSMQQHQQLQEQVAIYLISDESLSMLEQFSEEFQLGLLQSIQILHDREKQIKELFGVRGVPNTFVYGKNDSLLKNFQGETKAEVLYKLVW